MNFCLRVKPGEKIRLADIPYDKLDDLDKSESDERIAELGKELCDLLELMYAARQHSLLVVLQGRDTAGKDGTIRRILDVANVQGTEVASFKVPTPKELAHDYLWRVHPHAPERGNMTIFNRSHYEDVLVVRVHDLVPESIWKKRYAQINAFEELLASANTLVVKFFLHITKDEQEKRLLAREADPEKAWKLSVGDWKEREFWDAYTKAYEDALEHCSTESAPWYVVPANEKWYRDVAVLKTLVETLKPHKDQWQQKLQEIGDEAKREIADYRANQTTP